MILLDCNALCYQAYYTMRNLTKQDGTPTGVVYGFFTQIKTIVEQCNDAHLIFCWDSNESHRMTLCETYKGNRERHREEHPEIFDAFFQFEDLQQRILPRLGFTNNFLERGFEADDIIASICDDHRGKFNDQITIASNDQDLYQCLFGNVRMYKPSKGEFYTPSDFIGEYGLLAPEWVYVKAIAGCPGDNVIGIKGIGVKTVCKYLKDQSNKKYPKIDNPESKKIISRNWPLVCLPFEGTPCFKLRWPELDYQNWRDFCTEYEFQSFLKGSFFKDLFCYKAPQYYSPPVTKRKRK